MTPSLVAVVADKCIEQALIGILSRPRAIRIDPISFSIVVHPDRDPGCFGRPDALLSALRNHSHALVLFDHAWEGAPIPSPQDMEADVERRLAAAWGDRGRCIVIDPEIEAWVWSSSPHVATALGWQSNEPALRDWLATQDLWPRQLSKPPDPKRAFDRALRHVRQPRSSAIFKRLGATVSFVGCQDRSFNRLLTVLRDWFPESSASR